MTLNHPLLASLTTDQARAAQSVGRPVTVTAGAGSGKTSTLVAHYFYLLHGGLTPRQVAAITFTEKAAREMRTRIRQLLQQLLNEERAGPTQSHWQEIYAELDAAPIGTIHSLCAQILRSHPAEAGLDPAFDMLDEGAAAAYRAQAVEETLVWAANHPQAAQLFGLLAEEGLRRAIAIILARRLDAHALLTAQSDSLLAQQRERLRAYLARFLTHKETLAAATDLQQLQQAGILDQLQGDKLAEQIQRLLSQWQTIMTAWAESDLDALLTHLPALRAHTRSNLGRKSDWPDIEAPRAALNVLRAHYDDLLAGLFKEKLDPALDKAAAAALPLLADAGREALAAYERMKEQRRVLDFDDLEAQAVRLLERRAAARAYWRDEVQAVLVDEFQDTNDRQRRIVYALTGFAGGEAAGQGANSTALFVVGDGKQSIYRFRGADVTIFRQLQADVATAGGETVDLDLTFRTHAPLIAQLNSLLAEIMGDDETMPPYYIPFAPLRAHRQEPAAGIIPPYLEFSLGVGESSDQGRAAAAAALARRLRRLHEIEGVAWGDMALLFRASTGYGPYEDALEAAAIPYVTVAGRGFYDRPEVRDLLNALRAIANPSDDRALTGLLRSPAFALTDGAIFLLRRSEQGRRRSLWPALQHGLEALTDEERARAVRARQIIAKLQGLAGRVTVAQLLKQFLDDTHYLAILRTAALSEGEGLSGGERARRNVDKLLADAHASRLVSVGEFLEYLQTLRDAAAREGEAPVEAGDVVQLMTVHKAKGLQFPVVILADAGRAINPPPPILLLDETAGPTLKLRSEEEAHSPSYQLARLHEKDQEEAEDRRLLYVAATRVEEKLIVSGHVRRSRAKSSPGKLLLSGWLKRLGEQVGLDEARLPEEWEGEMSLALPDVAGYPVSALAAAGPSLPAGKNGAAAAIAADAPSLPAAESFPLVQPVAQSPQEAVDDALAQEQADPPARVWRVAPRPAEKRPRGPAWVVGTLVHVALQRWLFPGDAGFDEKLRIAAEEMGLTDGPEIAATIREAARLLRRLQSHPLYEELAAANRYHELPFTLELEGRVRSGKIDLLLERDGRWQILDFKTDRLSSLEDLELDSAGRYREQLRFYRQAVKQLLGQEAEARLCFLNVAGQIVII